MEAGTRIEVECSDLSSRGRGVGREAGGRVVMVDGAIPGDRCLARVTAVKRRWAEADMVSLLRPSEDRVKPRCKHFGECGGCVLQQMSPAAQRRVKTVRVRQLLERTGKLSAVPVAECVAVDPDWNYRARMEFSFASGPHGLVLGLHSKAGQVFSLDECHLPHPALMDLALRLAAAAQRLGAQAGPGRSTLQRLDLRRSRLTGQCMAAVALRGTPSRRWRDRLAVEGERAGAASLVLTQVGSGHHGQNGSIRCFVYGREEIWDEILGVKVPLSAGAFLQTRIEGAEAIYCDVLEWMGAATGGVLDLYAGCGVLGQLLAQRGGQVVAVERSPAAVSAGRRALAVNRVPLQFLQGDALAVSRAMLEAGERFPRAVVNPPRSGLHHQFPRVLAGLGVQRLAYISCDPGTFARDLGRLGGLGFRTVQVTPYDVFTHTAGVEVVAHLSRPPGRAVDGVNSAG